MKQSVFELLTIVFLFAFIIIFIVPYNRNNEDVSSGIVWDEIDENDKIVSYIAIQGFSELTFQHNSFYQKISFHNPLENNCRMNIELVAQDDETIFEVSNILPGYGVKQVEIDRLLDVGTYDCEFIVRCFSLDTGEEKNGATLSVKVYVI